MKNTTDQEPIEKYNLVDDFKDATHRYFLPVLMALKTLNLGLKMANQSMKKDINRHKATITKTYE